MKHISILLFTFCFFRVVAGIAAGNPTPLKTFNPPDTCNAMVNVAFSPECDAAPSIDAFVALSPTPANLIVEVDKFLPYGNGPWGPATFGPWDVFQTYLFRLHDTVSGYTCMGQVKLQDNISPVITCAADVTVSSLFGSQPSPAFLHDSLGFENTFATAEDGCGGAINMTYKDNYQLLACDSLYNGLLMRSWKALDLSGNSSTCVQTIYLQNPLLSEIVFPTDSVAVCSSTENTTPQISGMPYVVANDHVFASTHGFGTALSVAYSDSIGGACGAPVYRKWYALDWCNSVLVEHIQQINISDPIPPVLVCPASLSVNVWATDCKGPVQLPDFQVIQNCSGIVSGQAAWSNDTIVFPPFSNLLSSGQPQTVTFDTIPDFPVGSTIVHYAVTDACGNEASCSFLVYVVDTSGVCPDMPPGITCRTRTELLLPVGGVSVHLTAPSVDSTQVTGISGTVEFPPLNSGTDFQVACAKNDGLLNGVTTYDLILINKHILGLEPLNSPYKLIAADANRNGSVTSFDIVNIRSAILGTATSFPNNTSWRFIPSDFVFPDPANPFGSAFPDASSTFTAPLLLPVDFTAVKIGDLNNSADPLELTTFDERDLRSLFFDTENKKVAAGEEFFATFRSSEQAEGFQFTLHTDDLDILEVLPGAGTSAEQFAVFSAKNTLTVASETGGAARFALRLRSRRSGELRDMLRLSSEITHAEAYLPAKTNGYPEMAAVALRFQAASEVFVLHQNQPNPAAAQTRITFYLPSAAAATLSIFDAAGRTVYSVSDTYEKGEHSLDIDLSGIAPGVLYYQMQTEGACAIRKMMRL